MTPNSKYSGTKTYPIIISIIDMIWSKHVLPFSFSLSASPLSAWPCSLQSPATCDPGAGCGKPSCPLSLGNVCGPVTPLPAYTFAHCNWWMGKRSIVGVECGVFLDLCTIIDRRRCKKTVDGIPRDGGWIGSTLLLDRRSFQQRPWSFWKGGRNWPNWVLI